MLSVELDRSMALEVLLGSILGPIASGRHYDSERDGGPALAKSFIFKAVILVSEREHFAWSIELRFASVLFAETSWRRASALAHDHSSSPMRRPIPRRVVVPRLLVPASIPDHIEERLENLICRRCEIRDLDLWQKERVSVNPMLSMHRPPNIHAQALHSGHGQRHKRGAGASDPLKRLKEARETIDQCRFVHIA